MSGSRSRSWRSSGGVAWLLGLALAWLAATPAAAQQARVGMEVTVVRVSDAPGEIDPRARRVERFLRGQVAYASLSVLDTHHRAMQVDEVWKVRLPTRNRLLLRPLDVGPRGTLLSVDWEDVVQGDFRVRPGSPLIFGGPSHGDGRLVVVVDTR